MDSIVVALIPSLDAATTVLICCNLVQRKAWVVCPNALGHPCVGTLVAIVPPQAYPSSKYSHLPGILLDVSVTCTHE